MTSRPPLARREHYPPPSAALVAGLRRKGFCTPRRHRDDDRRSLNIGTKTKLSPKSKVENGHDYLRKGFGRRDGLDARATAGWPNSYRCGRPCDAEQQSG